MKKKLLAVILSVFIATTALPETAVMAAAVQESTEETVVSSGSVDNTETDSDVTSSESKTETGSTASGTDSESKSETNTDGAPDKPSQESVSASQASSANSPESEAPDSSSETSHDASSNTSPETSSNTSSNISSATSSDTSPNTSSDTSSKEAEQSDRVKDDVFEYQKISPAEVEVIAMEKPEVTDAVIPEEVTDGENTYSVVSVRKDALSNSSVESIQIPSTVKNFDSQELQNLRAITVAPGNEKFFTKDGVLFAKEETYEGTKEEMPEGTTQEDLKFELVLYPSASPEKEYVVPRQTAVIRTGAFFEAVNLQTIALQEGIEEIQEKAVVSPANALEIAFDLEEIPARLAKQAFYLDRADGNKIYFKSQEVLDAFMALGVLFADSPLMYDADGVLLSEYADVIVFSGEGIPKEIKKLINRANGVEDEEEEEEKEEAEEEDAVGAGQDAQVSEGYYRINTLLADSKFLKINNATVDAGGNVQIGAATADTADFFKITPLGDGLYTITAFCSNKAVSLNGTAVSNTVNVLQKDYTGDLSQK